MVSFSLINLTLTRGITFLSFDFDFLGNSIAVLQFIKLLNTAGILGNDTLLKVLKGLPVCVILLCVDDHLFFT